MCRRYAPVRGATERGLYPTPIDDAGFAQSSMDGLHTEIGDRVILEAAERVQPDTGDDDLRHGASTTGEGPRHDVVAGLVTIDDVEHELHRLTGRQRRGIGLGEASDHTEPVVEFHDAEPVGHRFPSIRAVRP